MAVSSKDKKLGLAYAQRANQLYIVADDISIADSRISRHQAEVLKDKIIEKYNAYLESNKSDKNQNRKNDYVYIEEDGKGRTAVHVHGHQVVYDEFGTGERGAANPHPQKSKYGMRPYNSGPIVSNQVDNYGLHYWYWMGVKHYGEAAGMFVYNATMELSDEKLGIAHEDLNQIYRPIKRRMGHRSFTRPNNGKRVWKGKW